MKIYVWVTFAAMGLAYYEMSGGDDFAPGSNGVSVFAKVDPAPVVALPDTNRVTRLSLVADSGLAPTGDDVAANPEQAALEAAVLSAIRNGDASVENTAPAAEVRVSLVLPVKDLALIAEDVEETAQDIAAETGVTVAADASVEPGLDLRSVNASRVNLRDGPGQDHGVLDKLVRGTTVQILADPGQGWVQLQVVPQGVVGWTADYLLDKNG